MARSNANALAGAARRGTQGVGIRGPSAWRQFGMVVGWTVSVPPRVRARREAPAQGTVQAEANLLAHRADLHAGGVQLALALGGGAPRGASEGPGAPAGPVDADKDRVPPQRRGLYSCGVPITSNAESCRMRYSIAPCAGCYGSTSRFPRRQPSRSAVSMRGFRPVPPMSTCGWIRSPLGPR